MKIGLLQTKQRYVGVNTIMRIKPVNKEEARMIQGVAIGLWFIELRFEEEKYSCLTPDGARAELQKGNKVQLRYIEKRTGKWVEKIYTNPIQFNTRKVSKRKILLQEWHVVE